MQAEQSQWSEAEGWIPHSPGRVVRNAQLVLIFGSRAVIEQADFLGSLSATFPEAVITGCSTAGEINGTSVRDETMVCTSIRFDSVTVRSAIASIEHPEDSFATGRELARDLASTAGLRHILVFSDGLHVNGTELVNGMRAAVADGVAITGGLAADGERFGRTLVVADGKPREKTITATGFYGASLEVGYGSFGGWDPFGPERLVTRASGNILYELDGMSALSLYRNYLGEYARDLPASALLFPLALRESPDAEEFVRTILGISEKDQSMTFAGDIPEGFYARFMKCNMDRLIDGAATAARATAMMQPAGSASECVAILISCVGRKMVLMQRAEEEVEAVQEILGRNTMPTGFYSYGEISPSRNPGRCELLNQTMTITTLSEARRA